MQPIHFYLCIFGMGVVCSIAIMLFVTTFTTNARKVPNYLSDVHYLQVRDDYSIYSLASDGMKGVADDKYGKKRNSVEGMIDSVQFNSNNFHNEGICTQIELSFADENEALSTLKVALELKVQGKMDKALRLFQHALALAPKHPEVLNKYGEYLEHSHSDVISADLMYFQVKH